MSATLQGWWRQLVVRLLGAPGTTVRRLALGVLGIGLLALLLQGVAPFVWMGRDKGGPVGGLAREIRTVALALAAVPPAQRPALATELRAAGFDIAPATPAQLAALPAAPTEAEAWFNPVQRWLGPDHAVRFERGGDDGHRLVVTLPPLDGVRWRVARQLDFASSGAVPRAATDGPQGPRARPPPPPSADARGGFSRGLGTPPFFVPWASVMWLVALAAVLFAVQAVAVRAVARPLQDLAEQLDRQQHPTDAEVGPLRLSASAGQELHQFVDRFNQLVGRVQASQRDRRALLAGVSHDLRTPLARLRLRVETQLEGAVAAGLEADLTALEHIVNQFLAYVQGESAPRLGALKPLPATVARGVAQAQAAGQPLKAPALPATPSARPCLLPEQAVERVLSNLIDNALAHGQPPVGVAVDVADDGAWTLRVSDGGPGMTPAQFEAACQPFVRLDSTRSDLGHCGLGLAIVAQMARHLNAELACVPARPGQPFAIELRGRPTDAA